VFDSDDDCLLLGVTILAAELDLRVGTLARLATFGTPTGFAKSTSSSFFDPGIIAK